MSEIETTTMTTQTVVVQYGFVYHYAFGMACVAYTSDHQGHVCHESAHGITLHSPLCMMAAMMEVRDEEYTNGDGATWVCISLCICHVMWHIRSIMCGTTPHTIQYIITPTACSHEWCVRCDYLLTCMHHYLLASGMRPSKAHHAC